VIFTVSESAITSFLLTFTVWLSQAFLLLSKN
jgi:hypothetical protein